MSLEQAYKNCCGCYHQAKKRVFVSDKMHMPHMTEAVIALVDILENKDHAFTDNYVKAAKEGILDCIKCSNDYLNCNQPRIAERLACLLDGAAIEEYDSVVNFAGGK